MNQSAKLEHRIRVLPSWFGLAKWASTGSYVLIIIMISIGVSSDIDEPATNMLPEGCFYLMGIVGIRAIWAAPEKRLARWIAFLFNVLIFLLWTWIAMLFWTEMSEVLSSPAVLGFYSITLEIGKSMSEFLITIYIPGAAVFVLNTYVIYVGGKGGRKSV